MQQMNSMQDLMANMLQGLYTAEQRSLQAIPQMMQHVQSPELREALQRHEQETRTQVQRLEQIFQQMGQQPPQATANATIDAVMQEAQQMIQAGGDPKVLEAGLICGAQKIEHLEMAGYGSARTFALEIDQDDLGELLQQTLDEEIQADRLLTQIAEARINPQAEQQSA